MERIVISSCALPCSAASAAASAPILASTAGDGAASRNVRPVSAVHRHQSHLPRVQTNRTQGRHVGELRVPIGQLAAARFIPSSLHPSSTHRVHCTASAGNADGTGSNDDKGEGEGGEEAGKERGGNGEPEKTDERKDKAADVTSGYVTSEDESADIVSSLGDWREFRARLIRGEVGVAGEEPGASGATDGADALTVPETGCVLLAHPRAFGVSQQYFNRAVIFLLMHGPQGTAGVILNRPSQYTLGQLAGFEELLPEFSACPLYLGGDVGSTSTHCLHGVAELVGGEGGAREVCPGVYVGGYSRIKEHVASGQSNSMDYRWFARYAGQLEREAAAGVWYLGACSPDSILQHLKLEREVAAGVWYLGACSPDLILRHSLRETVTVESAGDGGNSEIDSIEAAERGGQSSETGGVGGRREGAVGVSGNTGLWREVMELMGGEYAVLCKQADGEL
ncbi:unnamed protein product [Closterium sp. NIES-65]|nr:unnamed protein product [Closterium sp. NIES-65]CAI5949357.1 unnamed protein product [Closterium sp. NIES-65]